MRPPTVTRLLASVLFLGALGMGSKAWTEGVPAGNGDLNADGKIDISDVVYLFDWLFLGGEAPVEIRCPQPGAGPLPATGLTRCADRWPFFEEIPCTEAQDGFYQAGCPMEGRFSDHGDGTVTDHCTGLMWQKKTADLDGDGELAAGDATTWQAALQYCRDLELAGYSDWRLPNVHELESIVYYGAIQPELAIQPVFEDEVVERAADTGYWSSTSHWFFARNAWGVSALGLTGSEDKRGSSFTHVFARAVRQGVSFPPRPAARNGDTNGDGTTDISDAVHLLYWLFLGGPPAVAIDCPPLGPWSLPATGRTARASGRSR